MLEMLDFFNIEVYKKYNSHKIEFKCFNIDYTILNALRRIILSEIPGICFDLIIFNKNSSLNINEEFLGHRICLLPIRWNYVSMKKMNFEDLCNCLSGCQFCNVWFKLEVNNTSNERIPIYCKDFVKTNSNQDDIELLKYENNENGIELCNLNPNEGISLEAKAIKGIGKDHSKWSSVCVCHYEKIEKDDSFIFTIETNENVNVIDIFKFSIEIFEKKLLSFQLLIEKKLKYIKEDNGGRSSNYTYTLQGYDDTLLNPLVKNILDNKYPIDTIFYKRNHFLENPGSKLFISSKTNQEDEILICGVKSLYTTISFIHSKINEFIFSYKIQI